MNQIVNKYIKELDSIYIKYEKTITRLTNMEIDILTIRSIKLKKEDIYIGNISEIYEIGNTIGVKVKKQFLGKTIKAILNHGFISFKLKKNLIEVNKRIKPKYKCEIKLNIKEKIEQFKIKTRLIVLRFKKEIKIKLGVKFKIKNELEIIRRKVSLQVKELSKRL
ncbi:hypothetical protein JSR06_00460 [Candidatus Vidania fulgoroideae]|uniref:Uncharacterized protein n=1 Tax=Candidatus Vidania fulgoroideorum TaxID=881286 RepID=A0A974X7C6_9PROT|nr:hypothetical protein JSR06_00460 [Candidatus Vidania fulgoroideae]